MRKATYVLMLISIALSAAGTVPFNGFGPFISLTRFAAIPMVFFWFIYRAGELKFRKWNPTLGLAFLFYLYILFTLLWTPNLEYAPFFITAPLTGLVMAMVAWDVSSTPKEARAVVQALIYGAYMIFLYMLLQYFKGNQYYDSRIGGSAFDPNEVSYYTLMLMPIAWYLGNIDEKYPLFNRFLNLAFPGVCFAIVFLSGSRGGFVIAVPAYIYVFMTIKRGLKNPLSQKPLIVALALSVGAGTLLIAKSAIAKYAVQRFATIGSSSDKLSGRILAWHHATQLWVQHPIQGVGVGGFRLYSNHYAMMKSYSPIGMPVHNTVLGILTDYGLIGMVFFVAMIGAFIWIAKECPKDLKIALFFFLFIFILGSMDVSEELRQQFYVNFLCMAGLGYTVRADAIKQYLQSLKPIGSIRRTSSRVTRAESA